MHPNTNKYAHVLRPLLADEKEALKAGLLKDGLLSDLVIDQHNDLLDGHHRLEICKQLDIMPRFRTVTTNDPVNWIKGFQKARRNLDRAEMRQLIAEQVKATPQLSDRAIGKIVGVHNETVAAVRTELVKSGEVTADVIRFEANGRVARGNVTMPKEEPVNIQPANDGNRHKNNSIAPEPVRISNGRYSGLFENIMFHCADDNTFHSPKSIVAKLDPDKTLKLTPEQITPSLRVMEKRKGVRIETRPAANGQKVYKIFTESGKTITLATLKTKFGPVIKDLKAQAALPISHQSSGRFLDAAGMLIQLLRELEAE